MDGLVSLFSVDTVFFTIWDYPMSYIEFVGTVLYLLSVWLIVKKNMLTWPVGIVSVILYGVLFYQIQLYSDTIEQFYYLGTSLYGWTFWSRNREGKREGAGAVHSRQAVDFRYSASKTLLIWSSITLVLTLCLTVFMGNIHEILPRIFPLPASYPFLDALTTVMSFVAMFLMAQKRIESWIYWIVVDVIGVGLYYVKSVKFISLLYLVLLGLAVRGFYEWHRDRSR